MRWLLLSLMLVAGGCAGAAMQKRTYDVTVKNESTKPVTIWLTKDGAVYGEPGWKSPEDIAIEKPGFDGKLGGAIVLPGETVGTGPISGQFAPSTSAIVRIYLGQKRIAELLAMSPGNIDRIDTVLDPGTTTLIVSDRGSGIAVSKN